MKQIFFIFFLFFSTNSFAEDNWQLLIEHSDSRAYVNYEENLACHIWPKGFGSETVVEFDGFDFKNNGASRVLFFFQWIKISKNGVHQSLCDQVEALKAQKFGRIDYTIKVFVDLNNKKIREDLDFKLDGGLVLKSSSVFDKKFGFRSRID